MKKYKAIIFDLYGTLINFDSKNVYLRVLNGSSPYQKNIAKNIALCNEISFRDFHLEFGKNCPEEFNSLNRDLELELYSTKIIEENLEILLKYKKEGCKIGLISNLAFPYIEPFYDLGLSEFFDFELFSCEEGFKKPNTLIYQIMLNRMKLLPNEVLMIGNNLATDYFGPRSCGIDAFLIDKNRTIN